MHEFLISQRRKNRVYESREYPILQEGTKNIPKLREAINDLPKTAATFRVRTLDGVPAGTIRKTHVEFVGGWLLHDIYHPDARDTGTVYVNPNYIHSHKFSDAIVRCECGAKLTRNYEDGGNALRDEHNHEDDCMPYERMRARAEMSEKRHQMITRLAKMGWKGTEIAPRIGAHPNSIGGIAQSFNETLRDLRKQYRKEAGETYEMLVREYDIPGQFVADIYGHTRNTMTTWAKEYNDYETKRGRNQFDRQKGSEDRFNELHYPDSLYSDKGLVEGIND